MAIKKYVVGDILSESSHYKVVAINGDNASLTHHESGDKVTIGKGYIENYLDSADEVLQEVKVTKEDKKDGSQGIRSIFDSIHSYQVFTVCYKKQDVLKSKKKLQGEIEAKASEFAKLVEQAKVQKKGVYNASLKAIEELVSNPILPYEEGEDRVLRGFKIQFNSRDGRYDCVDMDIEDSNNIRPVNINTIKWLIFNGMKYIVEK